MSGGTATTRASQLWFTEPLRVEVREAELSAPAPDQVLVRTRYSAVSTGTELLAYRGELPRSMALDSSLASLQQSSDYPLQYGYACVGEVLEIGSEIDPAWMGRQVFSFQPHASHFLARPDELKPVPDDVSAQGAVFLPNMETAVNLVHDGRPLAGERVVVLGQGVVGLLLTAVLARHPLASLVAVEGRPERQELARRLGAGTVLGPEEAAAQVTDADLVFEVTGQPEALNLAIGMSGYTSRIVIGSWYGSKAVPVDLGGAAHRNHLQLITSQVSTVPPELSGRWDKKRRFELAWEMIRHIDPTQLITHTLSLQEAGALYQQLHEEQSGVLQPLFHYPD
ncbi:MAG: zinc-binding alcohol dehydrogenase [Pseudohongiellaceae bacterium]